MILFSGNTITYSHVPVSNKRLSELSYSVNGDQLRAKRRRLNNPVQHIQLDLGLELELEDVPVIVAPEPAIDVILSQPYTQPQPRIAEPPSQPKKRGRPKGSKNKPKDASRQTASLRHSTSRNVPEDSLCESFVIRRNLRAHSDIELRREESVPGVSQPAGETVSTSAVEWLVLV